MAVLYSGLPFAYCNIDFKTGDAQIEIPANKPYGMTINMGGDDVSVAAIVYKKL